MKDRGVPENSFKLAINMEKRQVANFLLKQHNNTDNIDKLSNYCNKVNYLLGGMIFIFVTPAYRKCHLVRFIRVCSRCFVCVKLFFLLGGSAYRKLF